MTPASCLLVSHSFGLRALRLWHLSCLSVDCGISECVGPSVAWGVFLGLGWSQWGGREASSEALEVALVVVTEAIDCLLLSSEASLSHMSWDGC